MRFSLRNKLSFTLIELLVVISIIGLLASVLFVAVHEARAKARDIKRITEAGEIIKALDMYLLAHGNFPTGTDDGGGWDIGNINHLTGIEFIQPLVTAGFFEKTPVEKYFVGNIEEAETLTYRYIYYTDPVAITLCNSPFYVLLIKLERDQTKYNIVDQIPVCVIETGFDIREGSSDWYTVSEVE